MQSKTPVMSPKR